MLSRMRGLRRQTRANCAEPGELERVHRVRALAQNNPSYPMSDRVFPVDTLEIPTNQPIARTPQGSSEVLTDLQMRIARRADQLATTQMAGSGSTLHCWLTAEREILGGVDGLL
jgi:hypothetical protein